jgi:hypothetical protein
MTVKLDCGVWPYGGAGGGLVMVCVPMTQPLPPRRLRLLPCGATDNIMAGSPALGAVAVLDAAAVIARTAEYIRHFAPHGIAVAFPYTPAEEDEVVPAAGRIVEFEADANGIHGIVQWTARGRAHLAARRFPELATIVAHDRGGAVENILSVVLLPRRPRAFAEPARAPA